MMETFVLRFVDYKPLTGINLVPGRNFSCTLATYSLKRYSMSYISRLPRTVYILGNGLLFDEIIAHMLSFDSDKRVINRIYGNEKSFLTDVSSYCPDVLLVNETNRFSHKRLLALLSRVSLTTDLRVIVMSLDNNNVHIFDQPANQMNRRGGVEHILTRPADWNELFDLIDGKQLREVVDR